MNSLSLLVATLALALPVAPHPAASGPQPAAVSPEGAPWRAAAVDPEGPQSAPRILEGTVLGEFVDGLPDDTVQQVRIEQRLIIRITPRAPGRDEFVSTPPVPLRMRERKMAKCVPLAAIAGVRPMSSTRLMLFLRDRRMVGADLGKSCNARDFYMGFYVSQTPDGQLCVGRDQIHSRSGSTCGIDRVRELIPDD
ncbi:hypothetical protein [Novosphingobium cyanobacteriorum]|uniref:Secreted protein n=1 Tax=Novosphingobium cyanobacteriorum TaxID=3024215 RepID=A0ABT6CM93_9SPHN|nr:hypothetical protein [Novosphingobium cyanobacteriorum]MDF8333452.1 hypothetical protein [Novosphingobium cyanobacteriorum]